MKNTFNWPLHDDDNDDDIWVTMDEKGAFKCLTNKIYIQSFKL